jgi:hypothetical protein
VWLNVQIFFLNRNVQISEQWRLCLLDLLAIGNAAPFFGSLFCLYFLAGYRRKNYMMQFIICLSVKVVSSYFYAR